MANFISSFFGNLNNEALEITQQSEVVDWLGNRGWNYSGSDYIVNNFNHNRQPTQSGVSINGRIANTISAYWACVQMIASDIAKLPLYIYEDDNRGNPQIRNKKGATLIWSKRHKAPTFFLMGSPIDQTK